MSGQRFQKLRELLKPIEWWTIGLIGGLAAAIVCAYIFLDVCDDQLAATGDSVQVCRHLQMTDPPITIGALVILALLCVFFSEVSGFGLTFKRKVEAIDQQVTAVKEAISEDRVDIQDYVDERIRGEDPTVAELEDPNFIKPLIDEYNHVRLNEPSGAARTKIMDEITFRMREALNGVDDFPVLTYLRDDDAGRRLAAVTYLYMNPDPQQAILLADAALSERRGHNEYWAWAALRKLVAKDCGVLDDYYWQRIRLRATELEGTGRARQMDLLLDACKMR